MTRNAIDDKAPKRRLTDGSAIIDALIDIAVARLNEGESAVWTILFRETEPDGAARVSFDDLARRGGIKPPTVSRAISSLGRRKLLQVIREGGSSREPTVDRIFPYLIE